MFVMRVIVQMAPLVMEPVIYIIFALQITRKGEHNVGPGDRGSESLFPFKVIHNLWTILMQDIEVNSHS